VEDRAARWRLVLITNRMRLTALEVAVVITLGNWAHAEPPFPRRLERGRTSREAHRSN
jgi:hypothetical protein